MAAVVFVIFCQYGRCITFESNTSMPLLPYIYPSLRKCTWKADFDTRCTLSVDGDSDPYSEVQMWINKQPNVFLDNYDDGASCSDLESSDPPDENFCYFRYRINCSSATCDPVSN